MFPSAGRGEALYGVLTGNVTDASDAAVPGAVVEAMNTGTGISTQVSTNDRGVYTVIGVCT